MDMNAQKLGKYELVRELGRGAMGVVYEGWDPFIGRRVAIKTARLELLQSGGLGDEVLERFLREARAAGKLNHPNIVTIYDADQQGDTFYIAMEFVEGGDLRRLINARTRLSVEDVVHIGKQICEALQAAHEQGIVHRDIKPANILLAGGYHVKVADFGIARVADSNLTQDGAVIGTPHYMSPEQFLGQRVDARSDLFSIGIILYELLTGEKPFAGESFSTVMHHVLKTDPIPPEELNPHVPHALNRVVLKALSKRPNERYADARALANALEEALKPRPDPTIIEGTLGELETAIVSPPSNEAIAATGGELPVGPASASNAPTVLGPPPPAAAMTTATWRERIRPVIQTRFAFGLVMISLFLVVLVTSGLWFVRGVGKVSPASESLSAPQALVPAPTSPSNQGQAVATPTSTRAYFGQIALTVYQALDMDTYERWENGEITETDFQPTGKAAGKVRSAVLDELIISDGNGKELARKAPYSGEPVSFSNQPEKLVCRYRRDAVEEVLEIPAATQPNERRRLPILLPPAS